jgi:hypothetical protein
MNSMSRLFACCLAISLSVSAALSGQRAPATPLITHDPYFSVWSFTDKLTDSETTHWTGTPQPFTGVARIDGRPFRFMGQHPDAVPAMRQISSTITPTHTRYEFTQAGISLTLTFFTPALPGDLDVLSRPVTYLTWQAQSTDGAPHQLAILLDVDPLIAVNDRSERVVSGRHQTALLNVLSIGSRDQNVLNRSGDNLRDPVRTSRPFSTSPRSPPNPPPATYSSPTPTDTLSSISSATCALTGSAITCPSKKCSIPRRWLTKHSLRNGEPKQRHTRAATV